MNHKRRDAAPAARLIAAASLFLAASSLTLIAQASTQAAPAASLELSADQAVALALKGNLSLASSRIDAAEKKRKADDSWNSLLPTIDVGATLAHFNKAQSSSYIVPDYAVPPNGDGAYTAFYYGSYSAPAWSLSASLSAQLVLNAALFEGMRSLKLDYEAGLITYAQAERQLERDVRKSFYSILLLEENMKLMQDNIDAAKLRVDQTEANFKAGLVPELSLLQARVAWENMKPALEEMRIGYATALDAFAMTLGLPRGSALSLKGSIGPTYAAVDADSLVDKLGSRLDIQAIVKTLETLDSTEKAMKLQLWSPSLILGWNADPAFMGDPFKDDLTKGASPANADGAWQQISGMFRATLSFRLNGLFPESKEAQSLRDMHDAIEKTRSGLAQAIRGSQVEVDSIVRKLQKSKESRAALELNVDLASRAYDLANQAYRAGVKDLLEVQSVELQLRQAQLQVLTEKFNYVTGLLDLEYAVNLPFGTLSKEGSK